MNISDHLFKDNFSEFKWGNAKFYNFKEGDFSQFKPTYKYFYKNKKDATKNGSYDSKRMPAWTDRIVYRSNKYSSGEQMLTLVNYDCNNTLNISDHKPVFA